jgi:hypothetical protein
VCHEVVLAWISGSYLFRHGKVALKVCPNGEGGETFPCRTLILEQSFSEINPSPGRVSGGVPWEGLYMAPPPGKNAPWVGGGQDGSFAYSVSRIANPTYRCGSASPPRPQTSGFFKNSGVYTLPHAPSGYFPPALPPKGKGADSPFGRVLVRAGFRFFLVPVSRRSDCQSDLPPPRLSSPLGSAKPAR